MTDEDRELMRTMIEEAVTKTVNGKIIALDRKIDAHIKVVEPYVQGAAGFGILWRGIMGIGALAIAWSQIKDALHH